jgi:hypothetical protein
VRFLRNLPNGLLSHPECETKASLYREALRNLPKPLETESLDPLLASYVNEPLPMSSWVPDVVNTALYLVMADQIFRNDDAFLQWIADFSKRMFEAPVYRVLMAVASPERLAQGARRRWENFHTGVEYDVTIGDSGTEGRMQYPRNLYDKLAFRANLKAIEAAYRASGARNAVAELVTMTSNEATFRVLWYPERAPRT